MKRPITLSVLGLSAILASCSSASDFRTPKNGDIIGHTSKSEQSKFIQAVTQSPFSHIGFVVQKEDGLYVLEAAGSVKYTPLQQWIARGDKGQYSLRRLHPAFYKHIPAILRAAERHIGKPYDRKFDPSDTEIYCSELVHDAIEEVTEQEVGKTQSLREIVEGCDDPRVQEAARKRWGTFPEYHVITPKAIMESWLVEEITSTY